jgi:hypothetical protein
MTECRVPGREKKHKPAVSLQVATHSLVLPFDNETNPMGLLQGIFCMFFLARILNVAFDSAGDMIICISGLVSPFIYGS